MEAEAAYLCFCVRIVMMWWVRFWGRQDRIEPREESTLIAGCILRLSRNCADGILTGHDPWLPLRVMRIEALCLRH